MRLVSSKLNVGMMLAVMLFVVSGCQMFQPETEVVIDSTRLESLRPADISPASRQFQRVENIQLEHVIDSYKSLLPLLDSPEEQLKVLHRLADLKLAKGEELMSEQAIDELDVAIDAYNGLLKRYPVRKVNDRVYYQLAKTYDLKGNTEAYLATLTTLVSNYPDSEHLVEAHFRRGEVLFSAGEYERAEQAFEAVIAQGDSPFVANSHYMKGWSEFKQARYETALLSFVDVLDIVLPNGREGGLVESRNQTLVNDLFKVMGLSFSYLGGADALEGLFAKTGPRPYEIDVYDEYSDLLIQKEQYSDAIAVYKRFIKRHPMSLHAPRYQIKVIKTLQVAGFKTGIVNEKVQFVEIYGLGSLFWQENKESDMTFVLEQLKDLLPELANRHYVLAQKAKKDSDPKQRRVDYQQAVHYYQDFIDTFPQASEVPEIRILLAESHVALENWQEAIFSFEAAGYDFPGFSRASEAAYASIIAYNDYSKTWVKLDPGQRKKNARLQQKNRLRFVNHHAQDDRADDVLYVSLQFVFSEQDYAQSIVLSERLLTWQPKTTQAFLVEAQVISAHSHYALADYVSAERAYVIAIAGLSDKDPRHKVLQENLAASVYRQAEARLEKGDKQGAIVQLLRVGQVAPNSSLRSNAEYDAISYMVELSRWQSTISEIGKFRTRYPNHELIATLAPKMALAFRETKQWAMAAAELELMSSLAETEQEKRDHLFIASELYDRAGNREKAINSYRRYANAYPKPDEEYMEAAKRLSELYKGAGEEEKRRFWLKKQMQRVDELGDNSDERMLYFAASASVVFANDAFNEYAGIKLKLPLNKSMIRKSEALEKAMAAFQKTASYGVSSFSTEAGYRMADIYAQLSRDLMESDRPSGLNELELEQYEILLEEQAFPFEDSAIEIHEQNASRSWSGIYDQWVISSFSALKQLLPGRYDKPELTGGLVDVAQ